MESGRRTRYPPRIDAPDTRPPPSLPTLPELPVGPAEARAAVEAFARFAAALGVADPRIRGFALPPRRVLVELVHCALLAAAWCLAAVWPLASLLVALLVLLSAALRVIGAPGLLPGPAGSLAWNLVLRPYAPPTHVLVAGSLDLGAKPRLEAHAVAVSATGVALGAAGFFSPWLPLGLLAGASAWVLLAGLHRPAVDLARVARVCVDLARQAPPGVAVVLSSGGAETAAGAWAFLDWWGLVPGLTRVLWLGGEPGAAALRRRGYDVRVLPPELSAVLAAVERR